MEKYVIQMHRVEEEAWRRLDEEERIKLTSLTRKFSGLVRRELKASKFNIH